MKRFGILQTAFPAKGSKAAAGNAYIPALTWRLFHAAGRKAGLQVLFFRSEDVDFKNRTVYAWSCFSGNGRSVWRMGRHALPDVLYENYPVGVKGLGIGAKAVKHRLARMGIPVFNPIFYNKASLHTLLSRHSATKHYMPQGKIVKSVADVIGLLKRRSVVYLKPIGGYQGRGIAELRMLPDGKVRIQSDKFAGNRSLRRTFDPPALRNFIAGLLKQRKYLVQEGLDLLRKDGRKIDFRVVVHRGADGKWRSAGIRPKLGKAGSIVTNSHAGGSKTTWEGLARWARQIRMPFPPASEVEKPALKAAEYLTRFRPTLSHLGIDVAVDRRQRIYLLDLNEVPGRDLLTPAMLRRVTEYTAGFASYLARR